MLDDPKFLFPWMLFLFLLEIFVGIPLQHAILVFWVFGREGYFHQGIRVLPGKPVRFSDGVRVPQELDILTGFGMFIVIVFGLTAALMCALSLYERLIERSRRVDVQ